jgi:hypothetical protein
MHAVTVSVLLADAEYRKRTAYVFEQLSYLIGTRFDIVFEDTGDASIAYGDKERVIRSQAPVRIFPHGDAETALRALANGKFRTQCMSDGPGIMISADIVAIVWRLLTAEDERSRTDLDYRGRVPISHCWLAKLGLLAFPAVDAIAIQLQRALIEVGRLDARCATVGKWRGKRWALCLTHDVDYIQAKYWTHYLNLMLRATRDVIHGRIESARGRLYMLRTIAAQSTDPFWSFPEWMSIEREFDCRSTFFFRSKSRRFTVEGRCYKVRDKGVREILKTLSAGGWEIGLHAGYTTRNDASAILREKARLESALGESVTANRTHYLCGTFPEHWVAAQSAGFTLDSTVGSSTATGYRVGTGAPFIPWDCTVGNHAPSYELPLIVMDGAIDVEHGPHADADTIVDACRPYFEAACKYGSAVTLLWHSERAATVYYPGYMGAYRKLLALAAEMGAFIGPCRDILHEWQSGTRERSGSHPGAAA